MLRLDANIICIILYYIIYDAYLNIYIRITFIIIIIHHKYTTITIFTMIVSE